MTEKEIKTGFQKINIFILIIGLLAIFATYYANKTKTPTTTELDPASPLYNEKLAEEYKKKEIEKMETEIKYELLKTLENYTSE